jgi:glycosyltransferase involved in cell wall biosynthesis
MHSGNEPDHARPGRLPRIVHFTTVPISLAYIAGHLRSQVAAGYGVHVISSPGPDLDRFCAESGAVPHPVFIPREIRALADLRALFQVLGELSRLRPDVVHAHTPKASLLGMIAAWLLRVRVRIYHCHGLRLETAKGGRRFILKTAERVTSALATRVLTVSESMRNLMVAEQLCPAHKLDVPARGSIGGVDAEGRFRPASAIERERARADRGIPADARVIGFVGRLVRDKGVVELFHAWKRLRERMPDLHWLVVGPFEEGDAVPEEVAAAMRADDRIHLTGLDWDTPRLFSAMDVLALPSYREGFPVVLLEAAAMALPVVASRATGCPDAVVDGVTGTLVAVGDRQDLQRALASYLEDPGLRQAHGTAARQRVLAEFRPEQLHRAVQRLYEEAAPLERLAG